MPDESPLVLIVDDDPAIRRVVREVLFDEGYRVDEAIDGLEALECHICWVRGYTAGVEFLKTIHPAVFDMLLNRLG